MYAAGPAIDFSLKKLAERRTDIFGSGAEETQIGKKASLKCFSFHPVDSKTKFGTFDFSYNMKAEDDILVQSWNPLNLESGLDCLDTKSSRFSYLLINTPFWCSCIFLVNGELYLHYINSDLLYVVDWRGRRVEEVGQDYMGWSHSIHGESLAESKRKHLHRGSDRSYTQSQRPCVSLIICINIRLKCEIKGKISMYSTRWQLYSVKCLV